MHFDFHLINVAGRQLNPFLMQARIDGKNLVDRHRNGDNSLLSSLRSVSVRQRKYFARDLRLSPCYALYLN